MTLRLSGPPAAYSAADQMKLRADIVTEDKRNYKRGEDVRISKGRILTLETASRIEVADGLLILTDTVTGTRRPVLLTSGVLTIGAPL